MELLDSRRLTGINIVSDAPGAVIDVALDDSETQLVSGVWQESARAILEAVGWKEERTYTREFAGGASLQISSPIDGWYAACEVNEWAWAETEATLTGGDAPPLEEAAAHLRGLIEAESNPRLMALLEAAAERGVTLLSDDEQVSLGLGNGSVCWAVDELPDPGEVDWGSVHDVPVVLITGTNGKTTTSRLLASMVIASGATPGNTSSDGVQIGGKIVQPGDYTGGEGARALLQDKRVDFAILESARGGLLRRGVAVNRADAAYVSNVGLDHLGEFGVADMGELADTKMLITRAIGEDGRVVLNADDEALVARAGRLRAPVVWVSLDRMNPVVKDHLAAGGETFFLRDRQLVRAVGGQLEELIGVDEIPITMAGVARYNIYNCLGAAALGFATGLSADAVCDGLRGLAGSPEDNPGRGNLFEINGARVFADFAHNPPGVRAIVEMAAALQPRRILVTIGQAGDRDDAAIIELTRATWSCDPDLVIVKELPKYLRGRVEGEVPALIAAELERLGAPADAVEVVPSELRAVKRALEWAQPGDLLLLLLQERDESLAYLREVAEPGWGPESTFGNGSS